MSHELHLGDCRPWLDSQPAGIADAVVTDPPYELGFMGKAWDRSGVAFDPATWAAVLRAIKPGGYLLAMGASRTYHRLVCAVEDAGFEVRDCLMWLYGTGFPKGKGCLKPAYEPILLCRRPGPKVLPLGIDECRVPHATEAERDKKLDWSSRYGGKAYPDHNTVFGDGLGRCGTQSPLGRWPANCVHDGSDSVMEAFAAFGQSKSTIHRRGDGIGKGYGGSDAPFATVRGVADAGTAARFFYAAKASRAEREAGCDGLPAAAVSRFSEMGNPLDPRAPRPRVQKNTHPTVKPLALMRWLVKLVCPPGGLVLDPFAGSGSTGVAALTEGRRLAGCELLPEHHAVAVSRLAAAGPTPNPPPTPDLFAAAGAV